MEYPAFFFVDQRLIGIQFAMEHVLRVQLAMLPAVSYFLQ